MKTNIDDLIKIKQEHEKELLRKANVTGIDVGYKYKNGQRTDEIVIRAFVEKKENVSKENTIPEKIGEVKTDVIERKKIVLQVLKVPANSPILHMETRRFDPLIGGIEIGPSREINGFVYSGTLGAIVRKGNGDIYALSNFHVMGVDGLWKKGDQLLQPSKAHGGASPADLIGELDDASLSEKINHQNKHVDAAISTVKNRLASAEILNIGKVKGTAAATLNSKVRKQGRTTDLTYGFVDGIEGTVMIDYGDGLDLVTLRNQIRIIPDLDKNTSFSKSGDSGSVIVDEQNRIVGLLFGGTTDNSETYANVFSDVEDVLNISVLTESPVNI
ncbi:hypothetical protein ACWA2B_08475 [Paenibacillus sp. CMM36]